MNLARYEELSEGPDPQQLTEEEMKEGWHFCADWDYLLVGVEMPEYKYCTCETRSKAK